MRRRGIAISSELLQATLLALERKRDDLKWTISEVRRMLGGRAFVVDWAGCEFVARSEETPTECGRAQGHVGDAAETLGDRKRRRHSGAGEDNSHSEGRRISAAARKRMSEATKKR